MPHSTSEVCRRSNILVLDAYDSFTNNIVSLLQTELSVHVVVIKIDDARFLDNKAAFHRFLANFDAVVAGPGPGSPDQSSDIGLIRLLWTLEDEHLLPVLGICLGFQSLALEHGARIHRLAQPRHGIVSDVIHCGSSLFANIGFVKAVQYHSLYAVLDGDAAQRSSPSTLSTSSPSLRPLAWVSDQDNGPTLMAAAHVSKPFWGLQFHPESICTLIEGGSIIQNWWTESQLWRLEQKDRHSSGINLKPSPHQTNETGILPRALLQNSARTTLKSPTSVSHRKVAFQRIDAPALDVANICEALRAAPVNALLLESGVSHKGEPVNAETGRFSIIGVQVQAEGSERVLYYADGKRYIHVRNNQAIVTASNVKNIWHVLKGIMKRRRYTGGPPKSPFWGGMMGFASYESCLQTINVAPSPRKTGRPDLWFEYIDRSVVYDHNEGQLYVQSLRPNDDQWIKDTVNTVNEHCKRTAGLRSDLQTEEYIARPIQSPTEEEYRCKVRHCDTSIRAGDSYELCLTSQTLVSRSNSAAIPREESDWQLYCRLRKMNAAPFSAFFRLPGLAQPIQSTCTEVSSDEDTTLSSDHGLTILSTSPERFLSWSRKGQVQLRPIKGTVAKTPGVTLEVAKQMLSSSKERAENLMIVDLIRHDLHGVLGPGNVRVSKLMQVEEYEHVFQLVTVIEGDLTHTVSDELKSWNGESNSTEGIDVLAASLPPGSMTGAPKKRSCEILKRLEDDIPRGIYSGVLGYLDVGGGGDFAVVIRTAWSWHDDDDIANSPDGSLWRSCCWNVGAGGAVTSQSNDEAEWHEMNAKRSALVKVLGIEVQDLGEEQ